jgi:hypothetical protein
MRLYSRDSTERPGPGTTTTEGGIRHMQRERPATIHHAVHADREAVETRVDRHPEFSANRILNQTYLDAPPPRAGYRQRWIKDGTVVGSTDDGAQRNWWMKKRQGWSVRDPENVPPELREMYPSAKLGSGQDAIRVASQVLCEIPIAVLNEKSEAIRELITRQNKSIPPSTEELRKSPKFGGAVGPVQVSDEVHSARGQNPELRGRNLATMA